MDDVLMDGVLMDDVLMDGFHDKQQQDWLYKPRLECCDW